MSQRPCWIAFVFDDAQEQAWFTESLLDEEQVLFELEGFGIHPSRRERQRHVRFRLEQPLTPEQCNRLSQLQSLGLFKRFYYTSEKDETESVV
ncbi:hypothetical protein [Ktedonobacter robiniae]|uniref:Uncharacterized protein n=1 Tax=Ktedonobacter robiniae TaxID=2778365 RepID=A0ABQ3V295_9CHLR|nr:hypothetical protein [Ktedonobacter robiniae]GHO59279.1 hypothetical protein KSB_77540 [Ktedonobacter robiniae]